MLADYLILFATAFAAATILPLPSEAPLAIVVRDTGQFFWPVLVATCGSHWSSGVHKGTVFRSFLCVSNEHHVDRRLAMF